MVDEIDDGVKPDFLLLPVVAVAGGLVLVMLDDEIERDD